MAIQNPLIKARETTPIINKTADIYRLLTEEREERVMAFTLKDIEAQLKATVISGAEKNFGQTLGSVLGDKASEIAKAIKGNDLVSYNKLRKSVQSTVFAQTAANTPVNIPVPEAVKASKALASFFNAKQQPDAGPENKSEKSSGPGMGNKR